MVIFVEKLKVKSFVFKYKYQFLILLIGLISIHLFDLLTQMSAQGIIYPDSESYLESAKNLYVFHRGHNYRPILMALINGIPYVFGYSDNAIYTFSIYVNLFCWIGFFIVLFEIIKKIVSTKNAFLFTVLSMFFVGNMAFVFHLLTENIYMFFIVVGFYFIQKYYRDKSFRFLSIAVSVFVLSMLIKPGSKFLAIAIGLFFIKEIIGNYKSKSMILIYGSVLMVFIQLVGIKYQFGNYTLSYIDVVTYHNYLGSKAVCLKDGKEFNQMNNPRAEYIFSHPCKEQKIIASEDLKSQLKNNSLNLFRAYVLDVIENTKTGNTCIEDCENLKNSTYFTISKSALFNLSKWQNRFFTIIGFCLAIFYFFKHLRKASMFGLIAFFILYIIVLSGISCGQGDRFHVITFPFVMILTAKWLKDCKMII